MDVESPDTLVSAVRATVGDGLRSMGLYRRGDLEFGYLRSDVRAAYSADAAAQIGEHFVFEALDAKIAEGLFSGGEIEYLTCGLADVVVYQFVADPLRGLFFSVDADAPSLPDQLGATVSEQLPSAVEGSLLGR